MSQDISAIEQLRKVFVSQIHQDATEQEVKDAFSAFGEITEINIVKNPQKHFCFITYTKVEEVDALCKARPVKIKDKEVKFKRAVSKEDKSPVAHQRVKKIFFANCTADTTEEMIREYLEKRHPAETCGAIVSLKLITTKQTGKDGKEEVRSKGYGFIECETEDLCDRIAIAEAKCSVDPSNPGKKQEFKKAFEKGQAEQFGFGGGRGRGGGYAQQNAYGAGYGGGYNQQYNQQYWGGQGYNNQYGGYGGYGY